MLQPRRRHRCGTLLLLLAGSSTAAASETLRGTLLVSHQAFVERLYISRRYERWFGGVAYLVLPGTAGRRRSHEATGATATVPSQDACDRYGVACFLARRGAGRDPYVAAYAQLFGQLATFSRRDEPPPWRARLPLVVAEPEVARTSTGCAIARPCPESSVLGASRMRSVSGASTE